MPAATTYADELDAGRVVAEEADPLLAVADRHQQLAVAAVDQLAGQREQRAAGLPAMMK